MRSIWRLTYASPLLVTLGLAALYALQGRTNKWGDTLTAFEYFSAALGNVLAFIGFTDRSWAEVSLVAMGYAGAIVIVEMLWANRDLVDLIHRRGHLLFGGWRLWFTISIVFLSFGALVFAGAVLFGNDELAYKAGIVCFVSIVLLLLNLNKMP